ncbi:MAG: hypothetical protein FWC62_01285 [Firmicutes bacterium]|nr:hypothetical protein [Bacillota bacterium]
MQRDNIIEELYYGNISPWEKQFDRDSEYAKYLKIVSDNEAKLNAFLSDAKEEKHLFGALMNAQGEILDFREQGRFVEGFQLGAAFMLDTFVLPQMSVVNDVL